MAKPICPPAATELFFTSRIVNDGHGEFGWHEQVFRFRAIERAAMFAVVFLIMRNALTIFLCIAETLTPNSAATSLYDFLSK